jgi:hypothetical protein
MYGRTGNVQIDTASNILQVMSIPIRSCSVASRYRTIPGITKHKVCDADQQLRLPSTRFFQYASAALVS